MDFWAFYTLNKSFLIIITLFEIISLVKFSCMTIMQSLSIVSMILLLLKVKVEKDIRLIFLKRYLILSKEGHYRKYLDIKQSFNIN